MEDTPGLPLCDGDYAGHRALWCGNGLVALATASPLHRPQIAIGDSSKMMNAISTILNLQEIPTLLRGEPERVNDSIQRCTAGRILLYLAVIFAGAGLFGAAVGCWRAPVQALYTALKL